MLERSVDDVVVDEVRHGHTEVGRAVHLTLDGIHGSLVAGPCTAGDTVVDIPEEHLADVAAALLGAIDYHTEATVDDLAPAYTTTVVDAHPRGATEGVADDVLYGHVGAELRTIKEKFNGIVLEFAGEYDLPTSIIYYPIKVMFPLLLKIYKIIR